MPNLLLKFKNATNALKQPTLIKKLQTASTKVDEAVKLKESLTKIDDSAKTVLTNPTAPKTANPTPTTTEPVEEVEEGGSKKKIMLIAGGVLAVGAIGYFMFKKK